MPEIYKTQDQRKAARAEIYQIINELADIDYEMQMKIINYLCIADAAIICEMNKN